MSTDNKDAKATPASVQPAVHGEALTDEQIEGVIESLNWALDQNELDDMIRFARAIAAASAVPAPPAGQSDAVDAKRYQTVKTMTAKQLLVWRGVYGFADVAIDEFCATPSPQGAENNNEGVK